METTENYHLIKPSEDDRVDVSDINRNSDNIDTQLSTINVNLDTKVGNTDTILFKGPQGGPCIVESLEQKDNENKKITTFEDIYNLLTVEVL